ncbi:MAG: hypothetical protein H8D77_02375 [Chloroflexi bacterium]|nr:hypothetical protein [Chloroflexota bacterium]
MHRIALLALVISLGVAACGSQATPTPDAVATEVSVQKAAAATLTAEAADLIPMDTPEPPTATPGDAVLDLDTYLIVFRGQFGDFAGPVVGQMEQVGLERDAEEYAALCAIELYDAKPLRRQVASVEPLAEARFAQIYFAQTLDLWEMYRQEIESFCEDGNSEHLRETRRLEWDLVFKLSELNTQLEKLIPQ